MCSLCDNNGTSYINGTDDDLDQDFAYQPYGGYAIGDTVWLDKNADGVQSGVLEDGIPVITVYLQVDLNGDGTWVTVDSMKLMPTETTCLRTCLMAIIKCMWIRQTPRCPKMRLVTT